MPTTTYEVRVYTIDPKTTVQTIPELTETEPTVQEPNTYRDIQINDDSDSETYNGKTYEPLFNNTRSGQTNGSFVDNGEAQVLNHDVKAGGGDSPAGSKIAAHSRYDLEIIDENGNVVETGYLYFISAYVPSANEYGLLGYASTIPLREGMMYRVQTQGNDDIYLTYDEHPPYSAIAPCFVRGALIKTPDGEVAIENLRAGQLVMTLDHGAQPIHWVGFGRFSCSELQNDRRRLPIVVRAGSLAPGIPERDSYYSRQHRILIESKGIGGEQVLIAAKDLIEIPGIEIAEDWNSDVDYFHILMGEHEIIYADGMASETLLLTDYSITLLPKNVREEIKKAELSHAGQGMAACRTIPKGRAARKLLSGMQPETV